MYRNAGNAGKSHRAIGKKRRRHAIQGTFGPAGSATSLITGEKFDPSVTWPIYVTSGTNPDGTLKVHILKSRQHADELGFTWVGRPTGASKA